VTANEVNLRWQHVLGPLDDLLFGAGNICNGAVRRQVLANLTKESLDIADWRSQHDDVGFLYCRRQIPFWFIDGSATPCFVHCVVAFVVTDDLEGLLESFQGQTQRTTDETEPNYRYSHQNSS
jgi:hypothetical protein